MGVPWHVSALLASIETLVWAGTERLATQGPFPKDRGAELGRCWQRTSVGAAWRCPGMLALQGCGHANHRTTAPGLTHVAIGNFCRAHAVRDALGAAGRTIPCKDGQMGWVARPPADRRGGEGWRAALTEGAITIAVIGSMAQEGVGDAAGMPCKMGGSLSATVSLPWHPWPGAAQPFGTEQRLRGHGSELTGEDRAEAGTYPVEMLGVPRKPWKGRDRVGETPKPQCSPASPRAPGCPCPPDIGICPDGHCPLGHWGTSGAQGYSGDLLQNQGLCHSLERAKQPESPQADTPLLCAAGTGCSLQPLTCVQAGRVHGCQEPLPLLLPAKGSGCKQRHAGSWGGGATARPRTPTALGTGWGVRRGQGGQTSDARELTGSSPSRR